MKAAAVEYLRPGSLDAALEMLAGAEGTARLLAGGQSLVPALNLRLDGAERLIDINGIPGLDTMAAADGWLRVGALVRHAALAGDPLVAARVPLLALAMAHVAHPAIRNRGTTCGSLAHADPAAEMPACAVALDAVLELRSLRGTREVAARDFYRGFYETARADDEMLVAARFPVARPGDVFGFEELARRHGDFAIVGLAARGRAEGGRLVALDLVVFGSEPAPLLVADVAAAVAGGSTEPDRLADLLAGAMTPMENLQGSAGAKRAQARALARRLLKRMTAEAAHG